MTSPDPAAGDRTTSRGNRALMFFSVVPAIAVVALVVALLVVPQGGGDAPAPRLAARPAPSTSSTTTTTLSPDAGPFAFATVTTVSVALRAAPSDESPPIAVLGRLTAYGLPSTMAVADVAEEAEGWVPVVVPFHKPNGTVGWVRADEVAVSETSYLIRISLGAHRLVLLDRGQEVLATPVIIGTSATPTPLGRFTVTDPVNCNTTHVPGYPVWQCSSAYGEFALGLSGLSEALDSFAGTIPQIAIHGTFLPASELGKDLSNGCIRTPNEAVRQLGTMVPIGTPVEIVA